jgi:hypothetical protein
MINKFKKILHKALIKTLRVTSVVPLTVVEVPKSYDYNIVKAELLQDELLYKDGTKSNKNKHLETLLDNNYNNVKSSHMWMMNPVKTTPLKDGELSVEQVNTLKITLPVIKKIVRDSIAWDIVGVQPMTGPVSQIHTRRVKYGEGQKLGIELLREVLAEVLTEAKTRTLSIRVDNSLPKDIDQIAKEIVRETDGELINYLINIAEPNFIEFNTDSLKSTNEKYEDLCFGLALAITINRICNSIAGRTRRGAGNFCVVSPYALKILENVSLFKPHVCLKNNTNSGVYYTGIINNSVKMYCNTDATDDTPILIGYNGSGGTDSGYFYCPYDLLVSGVVVDPVTDNPCQTFMTRFVAHELQSNSSYLGNSGDYYGLVKFVTNDTKNELSTTADNDDHKTGETEKASVVEKPKRKKASKKSD